MAGLVIDTSALVAIINAEPEASHFLNALILADRICLSVATAHELNCVMQSARFEDGPDLLKGLLSKLEPEMIAFDVAQLEISRHAYRTYGRGSGHAAKLNMADCYSYALAKMLNLPLLFKGDDFTCTDINNAF